MWGLKMIYDLDATRSICANGKSVVMERQVRGYFVCELV